MHRIVTACFCLCLGAILLMSGCGPSAPGHQSQAELGGAAPGTPNASNPAGQPDAAQQARALLAAGETFPFDFTLTDLRGQPLSLSSLLGQVVIVDIWGTWCPPCRAEIPSFIRLQNEFGPQGLQIIGLNYEHGPTEQEVIKAVEQFIQEFGINYPCALGTDQIQQQVPGFEGFPTTLFIDRAGRVRAKLVGLHDHALLQALVEQLLAEGPASPADAGRVSTNGAGTAPSAAAPGAPQTAEFPRAGA